MPNQTSKVMVKCDSCAKWMHKECMGHSATVYDSQITTSPHNPLMYVYTSLQHMDIGPR